MARRRPRGWHRQVRRKFVWDRTRGFASSPDAYGVDLLANFRVSLAQRIWAQLSLGFVGTSGRMQ